MNIVIVSYLPNAHHNIRSSDAKGDLTHAIKNLSEFVIDDQQPLITKDDLRDRALHYGDGCFTSMYGDNQGLFLFNEHLQRLARDCKKLSLDVCTDTIKAWTLLSTAYLLAGYEDTYAMKIIVSRGVGGRGYDLPENAQTSIMISLFECDFALDALAPTGEYCFAVQQASMTLSSQPLLAGTKHLNRLEQVLAKRELAQYDCQDLVLCDASGFIIEATAANIFYLKDEVWFTPSVAASGVDGIMREAVLQYFSQQGIKCQICESPFSALANADAIFLCNAIKFVVPVSAVILNDKVYNKQMIQTLAIASNVYKWLSTKRRSKFES